MLRLEGDKIVFDYSECQQCGSCLSVCPENAISLRVRRNMLSDILVDEKKCISNRQKITSAD